ncbi:MAG: PEP-CTERM sorting domain-containing protein [Pirellulales bacterium]
MICLALAQISVRAESIRVDIDERPAGAGPTAAGFDSFLIGGGVGTAAQTADSIATVGTATVTIQNAGGVGYDDRLRAVPTNGGVFTQSDLLRDFTFSTTSAANLGVQRGLDVYVTGLTPYGVYSGSLWSYDNSSTRDRVSDWAANGVTFRNNYTFNGSTLPTTDDNYRMDFTVLASADGSVALRGRKDALTTTTDPAVFVNAFQLEQTSAMTIDPIAALAVDFGSGVTTLPDFDQMNLAANGSTFGGKTVTLSGVGGATLQERTRTTPVNDAIFTQGELLQDFIFAVNVAAELGNGMDVTVDGLAANQQYLVTLWSYDSSSPGARASTWSSDAGPVPYQFAGDALPRNNDDFRFTLLATADATGTLVLSGLKSADGIDNHSIFLNAMQLNAVVPEPSSVVLCAIGAVGGWLACRRRKAARRAA